MGRGVALEITDREVRALWFTGRKFPGRKPFLTVVGFDRVPILNGFIRQGQLLNAHGLSELLKELKHRRFPTGKVAAFLGLPWQQGFVRIYQLPWFPPGRRNQAIRYFVEEEAPIPAGDLLYDAFVISEQAESALEVLIGAVKESVVGEYTVSLLRAGFQVEGVDFAVSALSRAIPFQPEENVLYLHVENLTVHGVLFRGNRPEIARTLQGFPEPVWTRECSHELERMLFYFAAQHPEFSLDRIVLSGEHSGREIAQFLAEKDQGPVIQEIFLHEELPGMEISMAGECQVAPVAFALAANVFSGKVGLNLWRMRRQTGEAYKRISLATLPAVAALLLFTFSGFFLQSEERHLRDELFRLQPAGTKIESRWKLEDDLRERWAQLQKQPLKVGVSLAQIEDFRVPGLVFKEIEYKQGGLYLRGTAGKAAQVEELILLLRQAGWENPTISGYQRREDIIEFVLTARKLPNGDVAQVKELRFNSG